MKVLIIEDDERLAIPLKEDLEHQQYLVSLAGDGEVGLDMASQESFDIILLDLMLPVVDGMTICRSLRQNGCTAAIIMISARDKAAVKIMGLDSGADDYLAKPFEVDELSARIRAVLRRNGEPRWPSLRWGDLVLNPSSSTVRFRDLTIDLTPSEYRMLAHFLRNPNRTYTKEELIDRLWAGDELNTKDVVKTNIWALRKKLAAKGAPRDLILTVYGFGYRLKPYAQ